MEQMWTVFYGLVTPFEAGGKEPCQGQARPPCKRGHATKVQGHKQNRARRHLSQSLGEKQRHVTRHSSPSSAKQSREHPPELLSAASATCQRALAAERDPYKPPSRLLLILRHTRIPRWNSKWPGRRSVVRGIETARDQSGRSARWTDSWRSRPQPMTQPSTAAPSARSRRRTTSSTELHSLSLSGNGDLREMQISSL